MIKNILVSTVAIALCTAAQAQHRVEPSPQQKKEAYDALRKLSKEEYTAKFREQHKRKPATVLQDKEEVKKNANTTGGAPPPTVSDAKFPGEFEEIQGVFISWPYTYDAVPVVDTMLSSPAPDLYIKLASSIQEAGAKVYITVWFASDTAAVKERMQLAGKPLTNYRFMIYDGDDIWARDFGPINYYYDTDDKIGWVDFKYYPGRDMDNLLPIKWGTELGIPVYQSPVYYEGGNILLDGTGHLATSTAVYELNAYYNTYTQTRTKDSISSALKLQRADILPLLPHDGGTGHIDLYVDMIDENTFVYTKMPTAMATVPGFTDYTIAKNNIDTLATRINHHNKPYQFNHIPFPSKDDGSWYTSADDYASYTRTYSNHLIVNKTIIQPIFSDATSGNIAGDLAAIDSIKKAYPGYNIVPIDMRLLDGSGGSIHCITKEFSAENPLRFFHFPYRSLQGYQSGYPIDAEITNKSGIAAATLYWRKKGSTTWTNTTMTAGTGNHWLANIPSTTTNNIDTFEYYLSATSINGKTITRPMPGAEGPYVFWYNKTLSLDKVTNTNFSIGNLYPNPATTETNIEIVVQKPGNIDLSLYDVTGKKLSVQHYGRIKASQYLKYNTQALSAGVYTMVISSDGQVVGSRKLIKK
ncbi:agmatine deiminase family protein [Taibaiella sp. KBW10]|uniref:agmatine deiminase family protein n=1 Tax=Taibaiella sp. KBW10 TaxID=2153357 RepID=UPI001315A1B6|nr:agmatine deiminase family protein [Taibaiella sp. KBW10]